jgi:hypothetical protein
MPIHRPDLRPIEYLAPDDYGGGAHGSSGSMYFYLIIDGQSLASDDVDRYFKTAVNAGDDHIFVFMDISTDNRLAQDLTRLPKGAEFFMDIKQKAPVFLVSTKRIPEVTDIKAIEMFPISSYEQDVDIIYSKMNMHSRTTRMKAIEFLERFNACLIIKPSIGGVGLNKNEVFSILIARLKHSSP